MYARDQPQAANRVAGMVFFNELCGPSKNKMDCDHLKDYLLSPVSLHVLRAWVGDEQLFSELKDQKMDAKDMREAWQKWVGKACRTLDTQVGS